MCPRMRQLCLIVLLGLFALHLPEHGTAAPTAADGTASALRSRLSAGQTGGRTQLLSLEALRLFYAERGYRLAWSANGGPAAQIDALVAALRSSDREGLRPADYRLGAIDTLRARLRKLPRAGGGTTADLLDLDLLLSDAFFLYAGHLTSGRVNPASVEPEWNIPGRSRALTLLLSA